MSRVCYPASPLALWLDLQKTYHETATPLVHWRSDCCLGTSYNILPVVACTYRGRYLALLLSKSVTISYIDDYCLFGMTCYLHIYIKEGANSFMCSVGTHLPGYTVSWTDCHSLNIHRHGNVEPPQFKSARLQLCIESYHGIPVPSLSTSVIAKWEKKIGLQNLMLPLRNIRYSSRSPYTISDIEDIPVT
jgi:hypothetical protein